MKFKTIIGILFLLDLTLFARDDLDSLLKTFEASAQKTMEDFQVPGMSIAIVKDGKTIYAKGFGVKEIGTQDKVDTHTLFQIGSISKSFTSALVAKAITDKQLNWQDRVVDHLPDFMMFDPWVTREFQIEDTLAQRSGLPSYAGDGQLFFRFTQDRMIHNLRYIEPITSFRSTFGYQNIFFNVVSKILEGKSGKSWSELIRTSLLQPLGMNDTNMTWGDIEKSKNSMKPHSFKLKMTPQVVTNRELMEGVYIYSPAGGINSNCLDMTKWLLFQLNNGAIDGKQIISKENMQKTHTAHMYVGNWNGFESYYCLGWILSLYDPVPIYWHNGGTDGNSSMCAFIPEEKLGIIILTNLSNSEARHALALQFFDLYFNKPPFDWSKKLLEEEKKKFEAKKSEDSINSSAPQPLENYVGTYHSQIFGDAVVLTESPNLKVSIGNHVMTLKPYNHDTFKVFWKYDEEGIETKANFCFDIDGKPKSLYFDALGTDNQGRFEFIKPK